MTGRVKVGVAIAVGLSVILTVGGALWVNRPFQAELGTFSTSLSDRTEAQRHNIEQAVMALDRVIIEPGEIFSFNGTVGPRTRERGYREAPAFMERDLVTSVGGGICQVSSTVYNAAMQAGLVLIERHPHSRLVRSVPPGRDATVWYGMTDLKVQNTFSTPVQLFAVVTTNLLQVAAVGRVRSERPIEIKTIQLCEFLPGRLSFQTFREEDLLDGTSLKQVLSRDIYMY